MDLQINIRTYLKEDWKRLCDIHDKSRIDELKGSVDLNAFKTLEETAEEEGLFDDQLWVAEIDDNVVGFIAFDPSEITWLYVDSNYYKKNIGASLVSFAIAKCDRKIRIVVLSENKPAINLYLKKGFKVVKKVKGKLEGNESYDAEALIMELIKS